LLRCADGWVGFGLSEAANDDGLAGAWEDEASFSIGQQQWLDSARRRIKMFEVWYKVPATIVTMHPKGGRAIIYDDANEMHVNAVARGLVEVRKTLGMQIRRALYAGPHRLIDEGTKLKEYPLVPFVAFTDDENGDPYGFICGMRPAQDDFNDRWMRIRWLNGARQVMVDNDALDEKANTYVDLAEEVMNPDMMLVLNANRRNANAVNVGNNTPIQREQIEAMTLAKDFVQDTAGRYSTQLGNAASGVTSGIANSILVEQGQAAVGLVNDHYALARRAVHERMLDLMVEDRSARDLQVLVGRGASRRVVVLNTFDPETKQPVNHVKDAALRVGLSDVPLSPAYRMQQQQQLAQLISTLQGNQVATGLLTPLYLEGSGVEGAKQAADDMRRATGMPASGDRAGEQEAQTAAKQQALANQQLMQRGALADVAKKEAEAQIAVAKAGRESVGAQRDQAELMAAAAPQPAPVPTEDELTQEAIEEALSGAQQEAVPA
jgi:hypothetical protein